MFLDLQLPLPPPKLSQETKLMPILSDPTKAPLPEQRRHGIVFASPADICSVLRCLFLKFEAKLQDQCKEEVYFIDRYLTSGGIEVPAILAGDVPDSYVPQFKGVSMTVLSNPRTIVQAGMATNIQARQWRIEMQDRSQGLLLNTAQDLIRTYLFSDSFFVPKEDLEISDVRVPNGVFVVNLYDVVRGRTQEFIS